MRDGASEPAFTWLVGRLTRAARPSVASARPADEPPDAPMHAPRGEPSRSEAAP